jgi:protein TonB
MLRTLLESNARQPRRRAGLLTSIAFHTAVIAGALAATAAARPRDPMDSGPATPEIIYVRRSESGSESRRQSEEPRVSHGERSWLVPVGEPLRLRFRADSLVRNAVHIDGPIVGAIDTGSVTCIGYCPERPSVDSTRSLDGAPATLATVDRPAALLSPPRPRYPETLRAAGVTGRVVVRLVVDTLGRVELASISVRASSHDLFTDAVRAVLPALRFSSAEAGGRKVRMLVDLPFEFRLNE